MAGTNKAILMVHDVDPRKALQDAMGRFADEMTVLGAQLLVAVYKRPDRTAGGVILAESTRKEDEYQGKVGLVLKIGPLAFQEDATHQFGDVIPKVGDWVMFNVGDTFGLHLGDSRDNKARIIEDVNVKAILKRPDIVL